MIAFIIRIRMRVLIMIVLSTTRAWMKEVNSGTTMKVFLKNTKF